MWATVCSLFHCLVRTKVSIPVRSTCSCLVTKPVFKVRSCYHIAQTPSWRNTPCRLSVTACSIYSQILSVLEAVPLTATWGRPIPWWHRHTRHRIATSNYKEIPAISETSVLMYATIGHCTLPSVGRSTCYFFEIYFNIILPSRIISSKSKPS
jgi:hypothetical protein